MIRKRLLFSLPIATVLTLVLGWSLTAAVFVAIRHIEHRAVVGNFQQRADIRISAVRRGLEDALEELSTVNQLFIAFDNVDREQFHRFTDVLLQRSPYIQAFNYHRIVSWSERPEFEAAMRAIYPGFTITEFSSAARDTLATAGARASYRVVDYLEPMNGNQRVLGFDADSYAAPREAMVRATETGLPAATELLRLVQESGRQAGFIVMMPIYRHGAPLGDINARKAAVIGDTAAAFRANDLFYKILHTDGLLASNDINIAIYSGSAANPAKLAFQYGDTNAERKEGGLLPSWLLYEQADPVTANIESAGKLWFVRVASAPIWFSLIHGGSAMTLLVGFLASILAAMYLQKLSTQSQRVQALVYDKTLELRMSNELLTLDIAARVKAEMALRVRDRAIEACSNAIIIIRARGPGYPIEYVNAAFERITGYTADETVGHAAAVLLTHTDQQHSREEIAELRLAIAEQRSCSVVIYGQRKDGSPLWSDLYIAPVRDETDAVTHFVLVKYDITETRRYQQELEFQASRDTLTGLANRNLLQDRLSQAIAYASRYDSAVWVVFIDLDRFKFINDTLGHKAGDLLLKAVAARLQEAVRESDTVARLGGDEFVLLLSERADDHLSAATMARILEIVTRPLTIEGHEFFLTCSAGVAAFPGDGTTPDTLMKHADIAMYRAKEVGRNTFRFYTANMNERALERLRLEGDLRNALEQNQFLLHYQPQVDLVTGKIVGMEALIRWRHPELGMIAPMRFIGLAEETGLILPIGAWVIRTACAQNRAWQLAGLPSLRIAVNLSARQFAQHDLVQSVAAVLQETGLDPMYLEIELTESLVMTDVEHAVAALRDLKALGILLSIDDFGTGYSSLAYLKRFPIDVLKIDRSFVRDITLDPDDAAIAQLIISLAHSLKLHVIAEGVETEAQLDFLRLHRCDEMQGFYFSEPVPAGAFEQLVRTAYGL